LQYGNKVLVPGELENQCILNVVSWAADPTFTLIELGAGRGDVCLKVSGAIDFKLVPTKATHCRCLAVEAGEQHCKWIQRHFSEQGIDGRVAHGAAWDRNGFAYYRPRGHPRGNYGSGVHKGRGIRVVSYTLGKLMSQFGLSRVNLVHMDVQSAEGKVCVGARRVIAERRVDYFIIETHKEKYARHIVQFVKNHYDVLLRTPVKLKRSFQSPIGLTFMPKCGLLLLRKKK
jgi:FkbM family methyltransferase